MWYSVEQVSPPLLVVLDDTLDTKGFHGPVSVAYPGGGSGFFNYVKLWFHERGIQKTFQSYFGGQVIGSHILSNKPTNMVCNCSEK